MPTYICRSQAGTLSAAQRATIAAEITAKHAAATGAPTSFCQVIFDAVDPDGCQFIGGRSAHANTIFVDGRIRQGRTPETKALLVSGIRDLIAEATGVAAEEIWVYLTELVPEQMIEFGQPLPAHGQEAQWMDDLPAALRDRLLALDGHS